MVENKVRRDIDTIKERILTNENDSLGRSPNDTTVTQTDSTSKDGKYLGRIIHILRKEHLIDINDGVTDCQNECADIGRRPDIVIEIRPPHHDGTSLTGRDA